MAEVKKRVSEGRRVVEMKGRKKMEGEDIMGEEKGGGTRKVDGRVMETIEEAYVSLCFGGILIF